MRIEVVSEVSKVVPNGVLIARFVDLSDLLARVENDCELLIELFAMFKEELPARRAALHNAIQLGDLHLATAEAHTLKGMLANMSTKHAASLAATIETAARVGDMAAVNVMLAAFDTEIEAFSKAVNEFVAGH